MNSLVHQFCTRALAAANSASPLTNATLSGRSTCYVSLAFVRLTRPSRARRMHSQVHLLKMSILLWYLNFPTTPLSATKVAGPRWLLNYECQSPL